MISVCVATYNGGSFIEEQLRSILSQLSENDEIVISDDGSTDDTVFKVKAMNDARIKWAGIGGRLGVVKNFERALYVANGDTIFLSDQDDVWLPGKVEKCSRVLKEKVMIVTDCVVVDMNLDKIYPSFFELRHSGSGVLHNLFRNSYLGCCMAFRKELLNYALPIPANAPMHDMWLGLIAESHGGVAFLPDTLILYRRHGDNASQTSAKSQFSLFKKFNYRFILVGLLLIRSVSIFFKSRFKN